ncbi:MAG TPA: ABC transporter ATP-binding protein [Vicinamibacterales bacterium]|nr:ABC transporter ATP-binding protein [Vicinamibacterales bacterium]
MLEARGLCKTYPGVTAVKQVSFQVRAGEILGYLGPNGSGKTTTVNMIMGLLEPSHGDVLFEGQPVLRDPVAYRRRVGYVPEEPNLYPFLSGREYLRLVGQLREMPAAALSRRIEDLLELFGLSRDAEQSIGSFSKGMKQKVLICAALLHDPDLLIFDEPLSGLDVTTALVFRHLVQALAERGKIILYSSHVLEVVEKICSKVVVLYHGQVVADDRVDRLREVMALRSLEEVFGQLVEQRDPRQRALEIADVVTRH